MQVPVGRDSTLPVVPFCSTASVWLPFHIVSVLVTVTQCGGSWALSEMVARDIKVRVTGR